MRNANSLILLAVAAGGLAGCHTAPPTVSDNVMACGRITDTAERYRCYDSLNTSMRPADANTAGAGAASAGSPSSARAGPPAASVATASAAPPAPVATPPAAVSTQSRAHEASPAPQRQANSPSVAPSVAQVAQAPSENQVGEEYLAPQARTAAPAKAITLHSSIASLNEVRPKIYLIKLANGQIWRHEGIETMAFFNVGDDVTIQRYLFGSYHMSSPATGGATNWVRVTRIE
jgi:hypothetical protein